MNRISTFLAAAFALAAPLGAQQQAPNQGLWDQTRVGMSQAEVRALYPAVTPDGPGNDIQATGASCLLKLDDQIVGEEHYSVNFCFRDDRLVSVALSTVEAAQATRFDRRRDRLLRYLRGRHGAPTGQVDNGSGRPAMTIYTWEQGCFQLFVLAASPERERGMLVASFNGNECPGSRAG